MSKNSGTPPRPEAPDRSIEFSLTMPGRSSAHSMPKPKRLLGRESAPFGQRGQASLFVDFAGDEMTFLVEMVVDPSMN